MAYRSRNGEQPDPKVLLKGCSFRLCVLCAGHGSFPPIDCVPDNVNGVRFVRDLYEMSDDTSGAAIIASHAQA